MQYQTQISKRLCTIQQVNLGHAAFGQQEKEEAVGFGGSHIVMIHSYSTVRYASLIASCAGVHAVLAHSKAFDMSGVSKKRVDQGYQASA